MFAQLSVALDEVDREIIEGDPWAAGGYMSLVTGGLFSGPVARDPMTGIPESALSKQLPMYVAYLEDKMLQMIMSTFRVAVVCQWLQGRGANSFRRVTRVVLVQAGADDRARVQKVAHQCDIEGG